jgi:antitoxin PrlF
MITSRLTSKARTTIPLSVRDAVQLAPGDQIHYSIEGDRVVLTKASRGASGHLFATFEEWSSEADAKAYGGL